TAERPDAHRTGRPGSDLAIGLGVDRDDRPYAAVALLVGCGRYEMPQLMAAIPITAAADRHAVLLRGVQRVARQLVRRVIRAGVEIHRLAITVGQHVAIGGVLDGKRLGHSRSLLDIHIVPARLVTTVIAHRPGV